MRRTALLLAIAAGCAPAAAPVPSPAPAGNLEPAAISAAELRRDLSAFAHDSMRGREAGTPDELRAARFIVERLQSLGVEPGGDSGYYHRVPLFSQTFGSGTRFVVHSEGRDIDIPIGAQLVPLVALGPGAPLPRLEASGDLVFAGYGANLPNLGRNDVATAGDVSGKVVVVVNGAPAAADSALRATLESQQAFSQRLQQFAQMRPAALIILLTGEFGSEWASYVPGLLRQMEPREGEIEPDQQRLLPMILVGALPPGPSPLLPRDFPRDDRAQPLTGRRFTGRAELRREIVNSYNVVGVIRGSDPALSGSYVGFGSHYDHVGILPPENGDSIANGADDDASGVVTKLALARSFTQMQRPPRRSMLLVFHTAEEKGLFGSARFVAHATVPVDSIVALINADMIGRNHPDSIYVVGPRAAPDNQSRTLGLVVDSVNARLSRPFLFNREWDSPTHPEQIFFRSDHYNYAKEGVPVVFFTTGLHDDYHRVSDSADKIDFDKLARVGNLLLELGLELANRPTRPR